MKTTSDLFEHKSDCCGCELCVSVCPKKIIQMKADKSGFFYPSISDSSFCIDCGACIACCPVKHADEVRSEFIDYYAGSLTDESELVSCASGGLATQISREIIRKGGVVYGAAYTADCYSAAYVRADTVSDLEQFKGSKYCQVRKNDIYSEIANDLKTGVLVLFIGLPCDVTAAARKFSGFSNLYTIELICHGPTSIKVQGEYTKRLEDRFGSKVKRFSSRYKKNGKWIPFFIHAEFENGKSFTEQFHNGDYGAAFRYLKRQSCYACKFKENHFSGDLMIGDYHYVEKGMPGFNSHAVSVAAVHNEKGEALLKMCSAENFRLVQIGRRGGLANGAIHKAVPKPDGQDEFRATFEKSGLHAASGLRFVRESRRKRNVKEKIKKAAVRIKRILIPSSLPK